MRQVDEAALLGFCFQPLHRQQIHIEATADEAHLDAVHDALVALLSQEAARGDRVERTERDVPAAAAPRLKSIVGRQTEDGRTVRVYTFGLRDAGVETALPLLGIALTIFTGIPGWSLVPQVGGVLKTLWSKLVVLERPADSDAIDALESLVALRAGRYANGDPALPSSADLIAALEWPAERLKPVLSGLNGRKIIEATAWGGQRDDVIHPLTRWRVKL